MFNVIYAIKIPAFVYWTIFVIILITAAIFVLALTSKHVAEKRKKDCFTLLQKVCESKNLESYKLEYSTHPAYDYHIENEEYRYLIKLIVNPNCQEICVNNAIKWQLRNGLHDKDIRFVEGVELLMRMDIKNDGKKVRKLFVIYPNSRALLKVINECEMIFVNPKTDIYGANIITFKQLEDDFDLIEL